MDLSSLFAVEGKVALVTGGSRGIGYMIAEGLLSAGMRVYLCARKSEELAAAASALEVFGDCRPIVADISESLGIDKLYEAVAAEDSRLHLLVNNAGASWGAPVDEYPGDRFSNVLDVNLTAPFLLSQRFLPLLRASAAPECPARIINISSIDGLHPPIWESYAYSASKAGVLMLTRHLAGRLSREHITVNAIAPGIFPSKMTAFLFEDDVAPADAFDIPLGRTGVIEDVAGAVIFLASRAGAFITGATIPVSGGSGVTRRVE